MFLNDLDKIYDASRNIGLVRNKIDFSERFLGRGPQYYRFRARPSVADTIPQWVSAHLLATLRAYRDAVSGAPAAEIADLVREAEAADARGRLYARR